MHDSTPCEIINVDDLSASYEVAINENPANRVASSGGRGKRAVAKHTRFWTPGRTLHIAFLDGDDDFIQATMEAANNWLPHINLEFLFIEGDQGDIRITQTPGTYWSLIGTDALLRTEGATMGLSPDMRMPGFFAANVMHEFGHALGALHEHQHPEVNIPWDLRALYAAHGADQFADEDHYARTIVDERYLTRVDANEVRYSDYDPKSIMHYAIREDWTEGDFKIDLNLVLSDKDKAFMAAAYPYPAAPDE
ncbi:hypothetical protein CS078_12025 [Pseudomonas prosekii]|uniref:Peptidase M12 n=2 Tax=Pseudomonas prosekii TaxID=1148509 RepID=A0A3L8CPH3_9PSED|nr:hypothetical protein [Pseudomonas prosekii]RLU09674.1 hypothetical protein CS078_12025 [Pseudomonas prosekii]